MTDTQNGDTDEGKLLSQHSAEASQHKAITAPEVLPFAFGASGLALLFTVGTGIPLRWSLLIGWTCLLGIAITVARSADAQTRHSLGRRLRAGLLAGLPAVFAYDGSRWLLWELSLLSTWPFEAIRYFGTGITGLPVGTTGALAAGGGLHLANGLSFACVYTGTIPRPSILTGIVWGLVLEAAMVTTYPVWLDLAGFREFVTLSVVGHIAYGLVLGALAKRLIDPQQVPSPLARKRMKPVE